MYIPKLCHDLVVALNEGNFNKIVEIQQKIDTYALFYEAYTRLTHSWNGLCVRWDTQSKKIVEFLFQN